MTLRQLWVRVKALPWDSPLWNAWRDEQEKAEQAAEVADIETALAPFKPPSERG